MGRLSEDTLEMFGVPAVITRTPEAKCYSRGGAGFTDNHTSKAAAERVNLNENELVVLGVLKKYPLGLTGDEIVDKLNAQAAAPHTWHVTQIRPRLTGLVNKQRAIKTRETRQTPMKRKAAVYRAIGNIIDEGNR